MPVVVTIGGVDRSAAVHTDSLKIEQSAQDFKAICSFAIDDPAVAIAVASRAAVTVDDNGTRLFAGEVANVDDELLSLALDGRRRPVTCHDYNVLVEEAVIDGEEAYVGDSDADIIRDLFTKYRADVTTGMFIATIDASMTITFTDISLRQALDEICSLTGGLWYVDEQKRLHYFATEANVAGWYLSDTPDGVTSFPYNSIKRRRDASTLVNQVLVVGKELRDWYEDAASVVLFGERPAVVVDSRIVTQAALDDRGAAVLEKWADHKISYDVVTRQPDLRAGMDVRLVCGAWGIDVTETIRRLSIYWRGGVRFYRLELGEGIGTAVANRRIIDKISIIDNSIIDVVDSVYDTDAPATPTFVAANVTTGVDVDADGHQQVYLQCTWGAVGDTDLDYYQIQISTANDFSTYTTTRDHPADGNRIERFLPVVGNTTYYARVRAVDWVGNKSAWSGTLSKLTTKDSVAPAQVVGLSAAGSRTLVGLSWTANTEADLAEYQIWRAPDVAGVSGVYVYLASARLNFYIDQDFTDGQIAAEGTWWYRVRAHDTSGNAGTASAETSATLSRITADHIAALTITAAQIAANTITANKMNVGTLSAISADLGTITAGTVTGATIRTAVAGARVQVDSVNGLQCYNAAADQTVSIATDGAGWLGLARITWTNVGTLSFAQCWAGGGDVYIGTSGIFFASGGAESNGIVWKDSLPTGDVEGYMRVRVDGALEIAAGGPALGAKPAIIFTQEESGDKYTPIYVGSDGSVGIWDTSPAAPLSVILDTDYPNTAQVAVFYNKDTGNDRSVVNIHQDHASAPLIRFDGGNFAAGSSASAWQPNKSEAEWLRINVDGNSRYLLTFS